MIESDVVDEVTSPLDDEVTGPLDVVDEVTSPCAHTEPRGTRTLVHYIQLQSLAFERSLLIAGHYLATVTRGQRLVDGQVDLLDDQAHRTVSK